MSGQKFMAALQGGNIKAAKKIITSSGFDASKSLFSPGSPQTAEVGHYPPIVAASESGNVEIVSCLLDHGAAVDAAVGVNGMTGLYIACQEGFYHMCELFISKGANTNMRTLDDGCRPLHIACQYGHLRIVRLLVTNGADMNVIKSDDGVTPLILAIRTMNSDIAAFLIESGADVSIRNKHDISALMIASNRGLVDIVQLLLDNGEDPLYEDDTLGCSAIDFAATAGRTDVVDLLKSHVLARTSSTTAPAASTTTSGVASDLKFLAAMNINVYTAPLQDHEVAGGETFKKEKKHSICCNPACATRNVPGLKLSKCTKCRCVRYCSRECQMQDWKAHKVRCQKPMCG